MVDIKRIAQIGLGNIKEPKKATSKKDNSKDLAKLGLTQQFIDTLPEDYLEEKLRD